MCSLARVFTVLLVALTVVRASASTSIWAETDKLVGEQKHQAALEKIDTILKTAKKDGQTRLWTEAQIRSTQLRVSLHGYETAVRELKDQPWPEDAEGRLLIGLFYAQTLMNYQQAYSWEIARRESTVSTEKVDLKAWTSQQIGEEIRRAFDEIMKSEGTLSRPMPEFFKAYVAADNYPVGMKPVLRDVVVDMATRHLANTQYWQPRESREIYKLDIDSLSRKYPTKRIPAADSSRHPLERMASWLGEHHAFHLKAQRDEAALGVLYQLFERLFETANEAGDRSVLTKNLKALQQTNRKFPWWSRGQALLAQQIMNANHASRFIEARAEALKGLKAFPESVGGQMCATIVREIEAPNYHANSMSVDAPSKRSILVTYKNLTRLYLRAYKSDIESEIKAMKLSGGEFSIDDDRQAFLKEQRKPIAEWQVDLPLTSDYQEHRKFIVPNLKENGSYVIVMSAKPDFSGADDYVSALRFLVSDLVLSSQSLRDETIEVRVLSGERGTPVVSADVDLYRYNWNQQSQKITSLKTDAAGVVVFKAFKKPTEKNGEYWNYALIAKKDGAYGFEFQGARFDRAPSAQMVHQALVFTDRSVFRPGQRIFWKVAAFTGNGVISDFKAATEGKKLSVRLLDSNSQTVVTKNVTTGKFGTASGEFLIPTGRPLGAWQVQVHGESSGWSRVRVEEYKRPTFEASLGDGTEPLRLNRRAKLVGSATYYFGQPVSSGDVSWRVTREEMAPNWWSWYSWFSPRHRPSETVASGNSKLNSDGSFVIDFVPQADERSAKTTTYNFKVDVDVTDEGGETRSASRVYRLGFVSVETDLVFEKSYFESGSSESGSTGTVRADRRSLDGKPRAGKARYRIVRLKQPTATVVPSELPRDPSLESLEARDEREFKTPDDLKRARWETNHDWLSVSQHWSDGDEVVSGNLTHDGSGLAKIDVKSMSQPGVYRLYYETQDDFGATFKVSRPFLVSGEKSEISVPLIFLSQESTVEVGSKARFFLHSGLKGLNLTIEVYRDRKRVSKRIWIAGKDASYFEMPVTKEDRGGFTVVVTGLRDHQVLRAEQTISVPWTDRTLALEFSSFRDLLRPGAKETFKVTVRDSSKKTLAKGTAEVLAYMYDRSLDVFEAHTPPSVISTYGSRTGADSWNTSLSQVSARYWIGNFSRVPSAPSLHEAFLIFQSGFERPRRPMTLKSAMSERAMSRSENLSEAPSEAAPAMVEDSALGGSPKPETPTVDLRTNFSETAFFAPHLISGADGTVSFEFVVPDSVTSWNVFAHALTKDWRGGSIFKETKSVKELMVRPYVPRFLREGDQAEIRVVVNNASKGTMTGDVNFDIEDPETGKSVAARFGLKASDLKKTFKAEKEGSTSLSFFVKAPREVGTYAFKVTARSKNLSDGERRPFPILPSRMHLAQSRFAALKNKDKKILEFQDLGRNDDATRINEKMVVTVDAQLFYGVLKSLPYLVNYPYQCIEQTLNRFLATGIVTSVFDKYPAVASMAKKMSSRKTKLERFDHDDPNRRMSLEESPWLQEAQGGRADDAELAGILDSIVAKAEREKSLTQIRKMQLSSGAFPWFEGGPPDEYMTLYALMGFGRAMEFGVEVPKDVTTKAWAFTRRWLDAQIERMIGQDCCWEMITLVNYAASLYPDGSYTGSVFDSAYRARLLDYSFKHWKDHSPLLKGYLALTLRRMNRNDQAKLVWDSVMDSSKTDEQTGTHWTAEDRSWLWYRDTVETHAFSLRALMELDPKDSRADGLVQWLFMNKKMNHWKSTRATAEAIYSLAHYLEKTKALGVKEEVLVDAGTTKAKFVFEPNEYTGAKNQIVIDGEKIDAKRSSKITIEKSTQGLAFASATWHFSTDQMPKEDRGDFFQVSRRYFKRELVKSRGGGLEFVLKPLSEGSRIEVGDQIEVQISLRTKHEAEYVHLRDPRAAGLEPENAVSGYKWDFGIHWYEETRDSGANFFFSKIPVGEYTFKYRLRAGMAGTFRIGPATVQSMYAPEFNAYSTGSLMKIQAK